MKIYILLDVYLNSEYHREFVDVFDSAEAVLKYMSENQSDGHKFEYEVREFSEPTNPLDYPWTLPKTPQPLDPIKPWDGITWQWMPCMNGGPCTNPHHDCVNCPWPYTGGGTYTTNTDITGNANDLNTIRAHRTTSGADSANPAYGGIAQTTVQAGGTVNFAAETLETITND
jgi:hypothetical protein